MAIAGFWLSANISCSFGSIITSLRKHYSNTQCATRMRILSFQHGTRRWGFTLRAKVVACHKQVSKDSSNQGYLCDVIAYYPRVKMTTGSRFHRRCLLSGRALLGICQREPYRSQTLLLRFTPMPSKNIIERSV
ncbi:hypothetical protein GGR57DRAFT_362456 [Xylariaceae sp. FL1272]|nr:hypothetical protein GGR57DRAFT_362456 [Xylariaceae sp. FL1272]